MSVINEKKIKAKLRSYLDQDKKNCGAEFISQEKSKKYIPPNYIDISDVKILLEIQKNECYICHDLLNLDWEPHCKYQITLDRINGQNPHLKGNILLACWYCNCRCRNKRRQCKKKCCEDKSNDIRKKKDVPPDEILKLLATYNEKVNGNYTLKDDWKDYEGDPVESEKYDSGDDRPLIKFKTRKSWLDFIKGHVNNIEMLHKNNLCGPKDCSVCCRRHRNGYPIVSHENENDFSIWRHYIIIKEEEGEEVKEICFPDMESALEALSKHKGSAKHTGPHSWKLYPATSTKTWHIYKGICNGRNTKWITQSEWDFKINVKATNNGVEYYDSNDNKMLIWEEEEEEWNDW